MADDLFDCDVELNVFDHLWKPGEHDGWTWVQTIPAAPENYLLFDASGELMGDVYQHTRRYRSGTLVSIGRRARARSGTTNLGCYVLRGQRRA